MIETVLIVLLAAACVTMALAGPALISAVFDPRAHGGRLGRLRATIERWLAAVLLPPTTSR